MFNSNEHQSKSPPADEFVQSAYEKLPQADEYLIDAVPPTGALIKADNPKLVLEALKDGKVRMTCSTWDDAPGSSPEKAKIRACTHKLINAAEKGI